MLFIRPQLSIFRATQRMAGSAAAGQQAREYQLAEVEQVGRFIERCLVAAGAAEPHAASLSATLVHADTRGHFSHGLNRLGQPVLHNIS